MCYFRKVRGLFPWIAMYCVLAVALVAGREMAYGLLLSTYARGFEKAALSAAAPSEWKSLLTLAETRLSVGATAMPKVLFPLCPECLSSSFAIRGCGR